jgi:hypothetical protein
MPCTCLSCMCRFEPNLQTGFPMWKISWLIFCCLVFHISLMEIRIINMRDTRRFPYVENKLAAILLFRILYFPNGNSYYKHARDLSVPRAREVWTSPSEGYRNPMCVTY